MIRKEYKNGKAVGETREFPKEMTFKDISEEEFNSAGSGKPSPGAKAAVAAAKAKAMAKTDSAYKAMMKAKSEKQKKQAEKAQSEITKDRPRFGSTIQQLDKKGNPVGPKREYRTSPSSFEEFNDQPPKPKKHTPYKGR